MLSRYNQKRMATVTSTLLVVVLCVSLASVIPVTAQEGEFMGEYDVTLELLDITFRGTNEVYQSNSSESLTTWFGSFTPYTIIHRPDYRMESTSDGYFDIFDQYSYYDENGKLIKSETTYDFNLEGYYPLTITATYEYGYYTTITNNETLFEETYNERYYEDGVLVESTYYHEYTFIWLDEDDSVYYDDVSVDAGEFECFVLDTYVFEGLDSSFSDWEPGGESASSYQGGYVVFIDVNYDLLIQQWQYDENDDVIGEIYLTVAPDLPEISETSTSPTSNTSEPDSAMSLVLISGGGFAAAAIGIVALVVLRSRRRSKTEAQPEYVDYGFGPGINMHKRF